MNKLIPGIFSSTFILLGIVIIYYWRDIQYDPSALDLVSHFFILPIFLCCIILAPYFIYQAYQDYIRHKKQKNQILLEQQLNKTQTNNESKVEKIQWFNLNIFSSHVCHAWGENTTIIDALRKFKSPELDYNLANIYGFPVLSYRIHTLDHVLTLQEDDQNEEDEKGRLTRIKALIQQQLEQQIEILWQVAKHLKRSALFYDSELAYQYRMHPAWSNTNAPDTDDHQGICIEQVPRLNRFNVHILLSNNVLHIWDEYLSRENLLNFMQSLGIFSQHVNLQHHYIAQQSAYDDWLKLLQQISKQSEEFSLIINADSEIDQAFLDEKMWGRDDYLPAEFTSSWCVAAEDVKITDIEAIKTLKVASNVDSLLTCLNQIMPEHTDRSNPEQPFVLVLDDVTDINSIKKNYLQAHQACLPTFIEPQHCIYIQPILGHTQQLAKIFGFMLGMHLSEQSTSMICSADRALTYAFFKPL